MEAEIAAGLKNAMERGSTLEQAVGSFIAAGYDPEVVYGAAKIISEGAASRIIYAEDVPSAVRAARGGGGGGTAAAIIILLLVIIGAAIGFLFYKDLIPKF